MNIRALAVVLGCAIPIALPPAVARADAGDEQREEAKRYFTQGSSAFLAKRYAEALVDLRASYKMLPSPNSGLLIARCLKELNRRVEAVEMYGTVAIDARRRASEGDTKYAQTAEVATAEGNAVRATLGTIRVRVARPQPGSEVEIDNTAMPVTELDIVLLHPPGDVTVKFRPKTGAEQRQKATVVAGGEVRMEFAPVEVITSVEPPPVVPPSKSTPPPAQPSEGAGEPPSWTLPAALVSGGVALAGAGVFVGFGAKSASTYDELKSKCGSAGCGEEDRARANEGKRDQTIANVGLAVGITGATAAIVFLLVRAYAPRTAVSASAGGAVIAF